MDRVIVKPFSKDKFEVAKDFKCYGYTISEGFITNGADIPRIFWSIFPPNSPEYLSATVLHDYMCKHRSIFTYEEADEMFYRALIDIGVAKWKAKLFYTCCKYYHKFKVLKNKYIN